MLCYETLGLFQILRIRLFLFQQTMVVTESSFGCGFTISFPFKAFAVLFRYVLWMHHVAASPGSGSSFTL